MSNNAAERELRVVVVGRRNWTFAGSELLPESWEADRAILAVSLVNA
jgi:hypothetical protein